MKKNRAFTLIELLAVIVILAIIALIATPIILGIVEDARRDAFLRSVELVVSTTDLDVAGKNIHDGYTYEIIDGTIPNLEIGIKNTEGMNGTITYDKDGNELYAIHNEQYCVIKNSDGQTEISAYEEGKCEYLIYTDESCFTLETLKKYEIIDVDKCKNVFLTELGYNEKNATSICNNESYTSFNYLVLTDYLTSQKPSWTENLVNANAVSSNDENFITGYSDTCPRDIVMPSTINGKQVENIASDTFYEKGLTSIKLPKSIKYIGGYAFARNPFSGELDLSSLVNLDTIGNAAFRGNTAGISKITNVKLPKNIAIIGDSAFSYNAFDGVLDLTMYNNLKYVSGFDYNSITEIKLPANTTTIGVNAFTNNQLSNVLDLSNLTKLEKISDYAFDGLPNKQTNQIASIKLPSNVTYIGKYAFAFNKISGELDLSNLTKLTDIGESAFQGNTLGTMNQITSLKLPSSVINMGYTAFAYNKISGELDLSHLANLSILNDELFRENKITKIKLPVNITKIEYAAFRDNQISGELDLSYLVKLKSIEQGAFQGSSDGSTNKITGLKFPSGLTTIKYSAFEYNPLNSVVFVGRSDLTGVTINSGALGEFDTANITFE